MAETTDALEDALLRAVIVRAAFSLNSWCAAPIAGAAIAVTAVNKWVEQLSPVRLDSLCSGDWIADPPDSDLTGIMPIVFLRLHHNKGPGDCGVELKLYSYPLAVVVAEFLGAVLIEI